MLADEEFVCNDCRDYSVESKMDIANLYHCLQWSFTTTILRYDNDKLHLFCRCHLNNTVDQIN